MSRLSYKVEAKIELAIVKLSRKPPGIIDAEVPDYDFFIMSMPQQGLRAMVALIVPVSGEDNTAPMDDIDPYARQDEYDELIERLWQTGQQAKSGIVLEAAPGLTKRASGLVVPS